MQFIKQQCLKTVHRVLQQADSSTTGAIQDDLKKYNSEQKP